MHRRFFVKQDFFRKSPGINPPFRFRTRTKPPKAEVDMTVGFSYHAVGSARVAELVDARDLKSLGGFHRAGSIPALGTSYFNHLENPRKQPFSPF